MASSKKPINLEELIYKMNQIRQFIADAENYLMQLNNELENAYMMYQSMCCTYKQFMSYKSKIKNEISRVNKKKNEAITKYNQMERAGIQEQNRLMNEQRKMQNGMY